MSRTALIWAAVALVVIAGGAYWYMNKSATEQADSTLTGEQTGTVAGADQEAPGPETVPNGTGAGTVTGSVDVGVNTAPMSATVTYNGTSFSPKDVTVKRGGKVTWTNSGSGNMWVASASHPTHAVYAGTTRQEHCPDAAGTAFDQCAGGQSYTFTFTKAGKWNYHDHINPSAFGSVTVVE